MLRNKIVTVLMMFVCCLPTITFIHHRDGYFA
ncbi:conserved hypothetical protein [Escherichia coli H299]|nr:conserved hypothetical protein [Escherichia coli H299]